MRYVIENPSAYHEISFLKSILKDVNYIILHYVEQYALRGTTLTAYNLHAAIEQHKTSWIRPNSKFVKHLGAPAMTKSYIASFTSKMLNSDLDYANLLQQIVIKRYNEIMSLPSISDADFKVLRDQAVDTGNILFAREMVNKIRPLLEGQVTELILGDTRYELRDVLAYIQSLISRYNLTISSAGEGETYSTTISKALAEASGALFPTYILNLGKYVFSNPKGGMVISVVAAEKTGKTRFVLGEHVYPALLLGKNVLYLTGEMTPPELISMLLVKHMYAQGICKLPAEIVEQVLVLSNKIRANVATQKEIDTYFKFKGNIRETIALAEHDLFYSGKYGRIDIKHISDKQDRGKSGKSRYFTFEEYFPLITEKLDSMPKEERYAVVVRDHLNHMRSISGMSPTEICTRYLQEAKTLCSAKGEEFVYIIINHIATELQDKIEAQGNVDGLKLRGHNSNEEGKTCDQQYFLYTKPGQRSERRLSIVCQNDRFCRIEEIFKTKEFELEADLGVLDFKFVGTQKTKYITEQQEVEDFNQTHKRGDTNE